MPRSKHLVILSLFFIAFGVFVLLYLVASSGNRSDTEDRVAVLFGEGKEEVEVLKEEQADRESIRESILAKLRFMEDSEPEEDVTHEEEAVLEPVETEEDVITIEEPPLFSIQFDGETRIGTRGSYCWEGVCADVSLLDIQSEPIVIQGTSTLAFALDTVREPDSIYIFLQTAGGGSVIQSRMLNEAEVANKQFEVASPGGEYLLIMTGVWDGNDVVNAFKLKNELDFATSTLREF